MRLIPIGGLCNRLQAILSYRSAYGPIEVLWERDTPVSHAHFLDVLEPIDGVKFVERADTLPEESWVAEDWAICKDAKNGWAAAYQQHLMPTEVWSRKVARLTTDLDHRYIAVHARRTDHVPNAEGRGAHVPTDDEIVAWASQWPLPCYIATDNGETQKRLLEALHPRGVIGKLLEGKEAVAFDDQRRNGELGDAVVDLFVCAMATQFTGTPESSFSETVGRLRANVWGLP